ncbi:MAG: prefoldin subunit beta [Candidatus Hydrothermarchaeaceae archaeon]
MEQLPQKLQDQLLQFQQLQQQAQVISNQRLQAELQSKEIERALAELGKLGTKAEVYKSIGQLLIKNPKGSVEKDLQERKDTLEVRVTALKRQEEKLKAKLKEMQAKLQEEIKKAGHTAAG